MKIKDLIFEIDSLNLKEVLEYCIEKANTKGEKSFVVTINTEIIMLARSDSEYERVLKSADLALVDGIGVIWAGKMFGRSFKGRTHGSDLIEQLSKEVSEKPITVGFLGGKENVAQKTADCLVKKYTGLRVAFATDEVSKVPQVPKVSRGERDRTPFDTRDTRGTLPACDILFVAFGSPKQEKWIYENLPKIDVKVAIGVGGGFDFISGRVPRAPGFVRSLGLEWLFRLLIQPWRIKRQLALAKFVILVLKESYFDRLKLSR